MSSDPNVNYGYEFSKDRLAAAKKIIADQQIIADKEQKAIDEIRARCKHDWQIIDKTEIRSKCLNDDDLYEKKFRWTRKCFICDKIEVTQKSKLVTIEQPDFD